MRVKFLTFLFAFGMFAILNTEYSVIGILPIIAQRFEVSIEKAGSLISVFAIAVALSGLILPLIVANIHKKLLLLLCTGIFVLSTGIAIFSTYFETVLVFRIIPGIFHPLYCSVALMIVTSIAPKDEVSKMISWVLMGISAGMVFGVPVSNMLANYFSYELVMILCTFINTLAFLGILVYIPKDIKTNEQKISITSQLSYLKMPFVWFSLGIALLIQASTSAVYSYFAEYIKSITHVSHFYSGILLFALSLATLLGNFIAGKLLSNKAKKLLLSFPFIYSCLYLLMFFLAYSVPFMLIIAFIFGVMIGINVNIQQYVISKAMPKALEFANGLFASFGNIGITLGTALGGFVIAHYGLEYIVFGGIMLLGFCFFITVLRMKFEKF